MNSSRVVVICADTDGALVQLENRVAPSFCLQGDTLVSLAAMAHKNAQIFLENEGNSLFPDEALDSAVYLSNKLVSMAMAYNEVAGKIGYDRIRPLNVDGLSLFDF